MTANLQTVKQMAASAGVSERMIYDTIKLVRTGREDLLARCKAGELTINKALTLAGLRKKPGAEAKLKAVWLSASESERADFVEWVNEQRGLNHEHE